MRRSISGQYLGYNVADGVARNGVIDKSDISSRRYGAGFFEPDRRNASLYEAEWVVVRYCHNDAAG